MPRIGKIRTELGGLIGFNYGQPHAPQDPGTTSDECPVDFTPSPHGYRRMGCDAFIQHYYDEPSDSSAGIMFNKWIVESMDSNASPVNGNITQIVDDGSDITTTTYTYDTPPDWAYAEQWGFTALEQGPGTNADYYNCKYGYGCNQWNDYRGHREVTVTTDLGTSTKMFFYTGMDDDRYSVADATTLWSHSQAAPARANRPVGSAIRNYKRRAGMPIGTISYDADGDIVGRTQNIYNDTWVVSSSSWPGSHRLKSSTTDTWIVDPDDASNNDRTKTTTYFDAYTRPYWVQDWGTMPTAGAYSGDEHTTCSSYVSVNSTAKLGSWIIGTPDTTATAAGFPTCTPTSVMSQAHWISGAETLFDGNSAGALPTRGNVTTNRTMVRRSGSTVTWHEVDYTYMPRGQVETSTDLDAVPTDGSTGTASTTFTYDTLGHLATSNGPLANDTVSYTTDPAFGVHTEIDAPNNQTTTITYDGLGRIETVTMPWSTLPTHKFSYALSNAGGTTRSVVRSDVLREGTDYVSSWSLLDGFARSVQTQTEASAEAAATGTTMVVASQSFQNNGSTSLMPVNSTGTPGAFQQYSSAAQLGMDRTIQTADGEGLATTTVYSALGGPKIQSTVETNGMETIATAPHAPGGTTATTTTTEVDVRGNTVSTTGPNGTVSFVHNLRDQVTKITGVDGEVINTYYSGWEIAPTKLSDPSLGDVLYDYDDAGRLETQTDGNLNVLNVLYNVSSQPTAMTLDTATGTETVSTWTYDPSGRSVTSTHNNVVDGVPGGTVTKTNGYDGYSRVNSTSWDIPGLATQTVGLTYRLSGTVDTITYPDGTVADYEFDSLERQNAYLYDGDVLGSGVSYNRFSQVTDYQTGSTAVTGDATLTTQYGYETWSGRLLSKEVTTTSSALVQDLAYTWDQYSGLLTSVNDTAFGANQNQCFQYETVGGAQTYRLEKAFTTTVSCNAASGTDNLGPDPYQVDYQYAANGNITNATGTGTVNGSYAYGVGAAGPNAATTAGTNTYTYDAGGLMTSRTIAGQVTTLNYDVLNRLINIDGPGTTGDLDALYDADGTRVKRTIDGVDTFYITDNYEIADTSTSGGGTGGPTTDDFNRANTTSGYGPNWELRSPYSGGLVTTGRITSNEAVIDASWTMAVHATGTGSDSHYAEAVVDLDASNNWAGPAVRLNATGNEGYALLARGGVNELRLYKITSGIGSPIYATASPVAVDGKTVRLEATGTSVDIYIDGTFVHSESTTTYVDANHRGVGVMGHNGVFDDFEATSPGGGSGSGGGSTTTTVGTFTDDFNRANTTTGYASTDWSLHTPYSGGTVTTAHITSNAAVVDPSWTMSVVDAATGTDTHYAEAKVASTSGSYWVGPAVRLNSIGNQGYAVLAYGGANDLRLYRINGGLSMVAAAAGGGALSGKTVRIEADGDDITVLLDGVVKITWTETTGVNFDGAGHQHTGVLGHNGSFDDFETIGTTTVVNPPPPATGTVVTVHHSVAGQTLGSTIDGVFHASVSDHLGSGSLNRSPDGTTVTQSYTPFGQTRDSQPNSLLTDLTFTGQTNDPGTGLVDYNARAYDPQLGRFVMADTVLAGLNRYTYVNNNPLNLVDPSGHCATAVWDYCLDAVASGGDIVYLGTRHLAPISQIPPDDYNWAISHADNLSTGINTPTEFDNAGGTIGATSRYVSDIWEQDVAAGTLIQNGEGVWVVAACAGDRECEYRVMGTNTADNLLQKPGAFFSLLMAEAVVESAFRYGEKFTSTSGFEGCSFSAETQVLMADGTLKRISEVEVGDWVLATDPETGETGPRQVTATLPHEDMLFTFATSAGDIVTTEDHQFWNESDREWQETRNLDRGDLLHSPDGTVVTVEGMDWGTGYWGEAWDLTVDGLHTFHVVVVGNGVRDETLVAVLAHNSTGCAELAVEIQSQIGGTRWRIGDVSNDLALGSTHPDDTGWFFHEFVVKDGLVYDTLAVSDGVVDISAGIRLDTYIADHFPYQTVDELVRLSD